MNPSVCALGAGGASQPVGFWGDMQVTHVCHSFLSPSNGPAEYPGDPNDSQPAGDHVGATTPGVSERDHPGVQGKL